MIAGSNVTAGGIPLYRHRRQLTDEPSMSRGDRAMMIAGSDLTDIVGPDRQNLA